MRSWIGVGETTDLYLLIIHQTAKTILWRIPFNQWAVLDGMSGILAITRIERVQCGAVGTSFSMYP